MTDSDPTGGPRMGRTIAVSNRRDTEIVIVLEPWATEYAVQPDDTLEVKEEGGDPDTTLEIAVETSHVVFYARPKSVLRAYRNGEELP